MPAPASKRSLERRSSASFACDTRRLAVDRLLRLLEIGNRLLHIEDDLPHAVVVVVLGLHELTLGLRHGSIVSPPSQIFQVPVAPKTNLNVAGNILRSQIVDKLVAGIGVDGRKPSSDLDVHVCRIRKDRLPLSFQRRITGNRDTD